MLARVDLWSSSRWGAVARWLLVNFLSVAVAAAVIMSDFSNPFADDPDFQYLALDRKKMLEEAPPYDPKTSCWIPDHKLGYIRSNIQSTKGDDVVVLTEAGEVGVPIMLHRVSKNIPPPTTLFCLYRYL